MGHAISAVVVTVTDGGCGEASDGAGLGLLEGVTWALGAGALGARRSAALVKERCHGDHAGQSPDLTRRLGDRPGFVAGG